MNSRSMGSRWSASVRGDDGTRARVYERHAGGSLQVAVWVPGVGLRRSSLGHRDRERAKREARALLAIRPPRVLPDGPATLGDVLSAYLTRQRHHADGTEKAASYLVDCERRSKMLCAYFGPDSPAESIGPQRAREYARDRRGGVVGGRPVKTESVRADLVLLKAALRWAATFDSGEGEPLLARSPLEGFEISKEKSPRRPLLTSDEVAALHAVAPRVHPYFPLLLLLAETTGRRISSILGLRWSDLDFSKGTITWRAELDKKRRGWLTPIPARAVHALKEYRGARRAVGGVLLFPSTRDRQQPVSRHLAAHWLKRALSLGNVPRPEGSLWHCLRRKWGTERKELPLPDVLAAGGWNSAETYHRCYAQATIEGMRRVVDLPGHEGTGKDVALARRDPH